MMRRIGAAILIATICAPLTARAEAVGLQLTPLEYDQSITTKLVQQGVVDVANPSDAAVSIHTSVQGFRQSDAAGDLAYYDDAKLTSAIKPELLDFTLGARQAVRMSFTIDPSKLPAGGVYAVIFFQTVPVSQTSASSFVSESAKVGTLLILNNGGVKPKGGAVKASLPLFELGNAIDGTIDYAVPGDAVGLVPNLKTKAYPWGHATITKTGLVLPASSRSFSLHRPGAYIGIVPVSVLDATTGKTVTSWTIACTGWYQTLVALVIAIFIAFGWRRGLRPRSVVAPIRRSIDGLRRL